MCTTNKFISVEMVYEAEGFFITHCYNTQKIQKALHWFRFSVLSWNVYESLYAVYIFVSGLCTRYK